MPARTSKLKPGDRMRDGTIYAGSLYEGGIFRVPPGAVTAERWIKPGANDSMNTLGVLADEKAGVLWVCSSDLTAFGVKPPAGEKPAAKAFDLKAVPRRGAGRCRGRRRSVTTWPLAPMVRSTWRPRFSRTS